MSEEVKKVNNVSDVKYSEYVENVRSKLMKELSSYNPTEEDILRLMKDNINIIEENYINTYNYYKSNDMNWRDIFDRYGVIDGTVLCLSWLYE